MSVRILVGDAREQLKMLPDSSVHCAITSPPYYSLRDYGHPNQIGLEKSPDLYVAALVEVFREVRRVLRPDGTLWIVVGDCFNAGRNGGWPGGKRQWKDQRYPGRSGPNVPGLKPKDLIGVPWLLAFALRADGWYLRSEVIWHKPACMPESVSDRPTRAHEQVFLFSKQARYYFDADAVREPHKRLWDNTNGGTFGPQTEDGGKQRILGGTKDHKGAYPLPNPAGRNIRSVWTISPEPFTARKLPGYDGDADHYAAFPTALVEPMVKASTSERGCCPACLAPWRRVVERTRFRLGTDLPQCKRSGPQGIAAASGSHTHSALRVSHSANYTAWKAEHPDRTVGWQPTCHCLPAEPIPCRVLDPFLGTGTTAIVADRLGRDAIGIELSEAYARIARARIAGDCPMFVEIEVEASV